MSTPPHTGEGVYLCFQIPHSPLGCLRIFTKGEHTEIKGLVLSLFQTTFTSFTFRMDTSQAIPLYQTFLHVFSFRKLHLSETGHSTLVTPNPGEKSSQASSEVGAPSQPSLLGLLPLSSSKKSICCQSVKKQNQDWLHLALTIT